MLLAFGSVAVSAGVLCPAASCCSSPCVRRFHQQWAAHESNEVVLLTPLAGACLYDRQAPGFFGIGRFW